MRAERCNEERMRYMQHNLAADDVDVHSDTDCPAANAIVGL